MRTLKIRGASAPEPRSMRRLSWLAGILLLLAPLAFSGCGDDATGPTGRLEVAVYQDGRTGVPGKQIEIRETSQSARTGEDGQAVFTLPAGRYVVRAYEIALPGPGRPWVEETIGVVAGETVQVEFFDCPLCR